MNNVELFQENICHVFLSITNVGFIAFENSSEGSLSEAFTLTEKKHQSFLHHNQHKVHFLLDSSGICIIVLKIEG